MLRRMMMTGLMLWLLAACGSADAADVFQLWAILSAPEVASSGLSDLLTVELSQRSFDLVEREQLAAITKEIELSTLLSPEGSSQRLNVGQLTKADALVLLSLVEHDKKKFVKLVISDCQYGSRLRLDHFPVAADRADKLAAEIAQAATETRTKFARGVERIVAVSPFLSKNVTREFDHLQFGFAALLGQSLAQHPGVAVLEIEEARSIGEELTRSASKLERRQVPLFVEGEFEITPSNDASSEPGDWGSVHFALRILDGSAERETLTNRSKGRTDAVDWLTKSLSSRLLRRDG
ncbi:MAG TPA: CsgG/HfaB family protein, partial [Planctomycetaceae bacterium]|nr:CsgG/HfaB family protein [Planctomycetaceae bacterium]